jgi:predicted ATPase with chaperone activity
MQLLWRLAQTPHLCARCGYKISKANFGSLLDRIDIHIEVPRVDYEKLSSQRVSESSESIRARAQAAMSQLNLLTRTYHRTRSVKLARTIADLAGSEEIQSAHLAEALQYRPRLMMGNWKNAPAYRRCGHPPVFQVEH